MTPIEIWKDEAGQYVDAADTNRVTLVAPYGWEVKPDVIPATFWPAAPQLTGIDPQDATLGNPRLTTVLTGSNFTSHSEVLVNDELAVVTLISPTEMEAVINPRAVAAAGALVVKVRDNFGQESNTRNFQIKAPVKES